MNVFHSLRIQTSWDHTLRRRKAVHSKESCARHRLRQPVLVRHRWKRRSSHLPDDNGRPGQTATSQILTNSPVASRCRRWALGDFFITWTTIGNISWCHIAITIALSTSWSSSIVKDHIGEHTDRLLKNYRILFMNLHGFHHSRDWFSSGKLLDICLTVSCKRLEGNFESLSVIHVGLEPPHRQIYDLNASWSVMFYCLPVALYVVSMQGSCWRWSHTARRECPYPNPQTGHFQKSVDKQNVSRFRSAGRTTELTVDRRAVSLKFGERIPSSYLHGCQWWGWFDSLWCVFSFCRSDHQQQQQATTTSNSKHIQPWRPLDTPLFSLSWSWRQSPRPFKFRHHPMSRLEECPAVLVAWKKTPRHFLPLTRSPKQIAMSRPPR